MNLLAVTGLLFAGALDWSVYSPLDVPLEIEQRTDKPVARIYAARGEYEGLHLSVTARKRAAVGVTIDALAPGKDLPAPIVYQMLPVTGAEIKSECLDVLAPALPVGLEPGSTAHFWIRYAIPAGAKPGVRNSSLRIVTDGERAIEVPLRVEIFDVVLPEKPSLPNVFYFDRVAFRRVFELKDPELAPWQPYYEAMGGFRLGFSLWDGTGLATAQDSTQLQEHLAFAAQVMGPAALDLSGGNGAGWQGVPRAAAGQTIDPLSLYLNRVLAAPGLGETTMTAAFDTFPNRSAWPKTIVQLGRLANATSVLRVAAAPLHPDFEPVLDAWAVPFRQSNPALLARLREGGGITGSNSFPSARFSASTSGVNSLGTPYASLPADAADGSPYTAWFPVRVKPGAEDHWWQADFDEPAFLEEIIFTWAVGRAAESLELYTTLDGRSYAQASVNWEQQAAPNPVEWPTSRAKLRFPANALGMRLIIHVSKDAILPALAEAALANAIQDAAEIKAHPIHPWLALELDTFPTTYPGRPIVEPRMIGWVCWFGGFEGLLGASLNAWPANLAPPYDLPQDAGDFLFYPVDNTLQPSLRLERLRDGLEDYEYLHLLKEASDRGDKLPLGAAELLNPLTLSPTPNEDELAPWTKHILETRIQIGRALSNKGNAGSLQGRKSK